MMCSEVFNAITLLLQTQSDEFDLADIQNFILSKLKDVNSYPENKQHEISEAIMILIGTLEPSEMILVFSKISELISQQLKDKYLPHAPISGFPMQQMVPPMASGVQQMPALPMSAFPMSAFPQMPALPMSAFPQMPQMQQVPQIPQPGFSLIGNPQIAPAFSLPTVSQMQPMESPNPFLGLPIQPTQPMPPMRSPRSSQEIQDELPENDNEDSFPEPRRTKRELDTELDHLAADREKHYTATNAKQACDCDQCDADRLANQWHRHCIHNKPRESNIKKLEDEKLEAKKLEAEKLEAEKNERAKRFGQHICCPQCGSTRLALREVPARSADESSSLLFRCNRCGTNGRKD